MAQYLLLVSLLLCVLVAVNGDIVIVVKPPHHNHNHTHSPSMKPPTHSAPTPRKKVVVRGSVYCRFCKDRDNMETFSIKGAMVKLSCNNTKHELVEKVVTDKNGWFYFRPEKVSTFGFHKCKAFLVSSPLHKCNVATNFAAGITGAMLYPVRTNKTLPYQLYSVGPFAFEPHMLLCP